MTLRADVEWAIEQALTPFCLEHATDAVMDTLDILDEWDEEWDDDEEEDDGDDD